MVLIMWIVVMVIIVMLFCTLGSSDLRKARTRMTRPAELEQLQPNH